MYSYYYSDPDVMSVIFGAYATIVGFAALIFGILAIVGMWKVFTKAGEPGWTALIPFVNSYKMFKIAWGNGRLFLLCLIPIVNIVVGIMLCIKMARAFGKGTGFAVGLIFLPSIFFIILGFSDAVYYGPVRN